MEMFRHNLKITNEMAEKLNMYADKMAISRNSLICMILSEWLDVQAKKDRILSDENLKNMLAEMTLKGIKNKGGFNE